MDKSKTDSDKIKPTKKCEFYGDGVSCPWYKMDRNGNYHVHVTGEKK